MHGAYAALATLVDGVDTALLDLRDCQLAGLGATVRCYLLGSVPYAASVATIEYHRRRRTADDIAAVHA